METFEGIPLRTELQPSGLNHTALVLTRFKPFLDFILTFGLKAKSGTANPQDATSFHPGQWDICDCHIPPDVYYQAFRKAEDNVTKNWDMPSIICKDDGTEIRLPIEDRPKYDENGEPMRDINGNYVIECIKDLSGKMIEHPLYDFEILPLQIRYVIEFKS